jgi:hypothetical protein
MAGSMGFTNNDNAICKKLVLKNNPVNPTICEIRCVPRRATKYIYPKVHFKP